MIKRVIFSIFLLVFAILFSPFASAEIIFHGQPNEVYNLGDTLTISATIKTITGSTGTFNMDLLCEGNSVNFYKNGISLTAGEEKDAEASLIFTKNLIGEMNGMCKVKGTFKNDYALTNEFLVSDKINIFPEEGKVIFTPGVPAMIKGSATNENGEPANGFIDLRVIQNGKDLLSKHDTINNGFFSIEITFPEDTEAGRYLLELNAYEEEPGESINEKTNLGFTAYNIELTQVPESLEIILDEKVIPGTNARIKPILHDQTGKNIDSLAKITIKDDKNRVVEQAEKATGEYFELPIAYNQAPAGWKAEVESGGFTSAADFFIQQKKDVNITIANNTLLVTNAGNVPYEDALKVKIGSEEIFIDVNLKVDESKRYLLTAPDGKYQIAILENNGEVSALSSFLTGRVIDAKEKRGFQIFSLAWIFIILILGYTAYFLFKRQHKKSFLGFMPSPSAKKENPVFVSGAELPLRSYSNLVSRNPLEASLSIRGEKQKTTAVCLYIKNLNQIEKTKGDAEKILQRIVDFAEDNKAMTYENQDYLFFVFAPSKTRTFKNETTALKIAQEAKRALTEQNRIFRQKINFGISINNGEIILKKENGPMKFASMGKFIGNSKRLASLSNGGEATFSKEVAEALKTEVKSGQISEGVYNIKEIKRDSQSNKKFVDDLVKKWGRESH